VVRARSDRRSDLWDTVVKSRTKRGGNSGSSGGKDRVEPDVFTVWIGGPDWIRIGIQDGLLPRNENLGAYDLGLGVEKHPQG
jgi:hypothetical protein